MNISKLYKKIKSHNDRDRSKLYITPFHEWSIMLFLSAIIAVVVIFFCYGAFNDIYINGLKLSIAELTGPVTEETSQFLLCRMISVASRSEVSSFEQNSHSQ